jgi:hypothetical protein
LKEVPELQEQVSEHVSGPSLVPPVVLVREEALWEVLKDLVGLALGDHHPMLQVKVAGQREEWAQQLGLEWERQEVN